MILDEIIPEILKLNEQAEIDLKPIYEKIDKVCLANSNKVLSAFIENKWAVVINGGPEENRQSN